MGCPGSGEHRGVVFSQGLKGPGHVFVSSCETGTCEVTVPLGVVCFADAENMHVLCDYVCLYGEVSSNCSRMNTPLQGVSQTLDGGFIFDIHTCSDLFREDSHFNLYLPVGLKLPTRTCPSPDIRSPLATGANREPPQLLVSEMVGGKKHGTKTETWELAQSQVWSFDVPTFSRP